MLAQNAAAPAAETHGIVVANMDRSVKPGDDFYRYANGSWISRTEIPPDRRYIDPNGLDFDDSNDLTRKRIAGLIEEATKTNAPAGSNARKIADFYHSYMDEATIEAKGLAPLRQQLDAMAAIRNKHDLARALGESLRADVDGLNDDFHTANLFGLWVAPGFNDPEHYAAYLLQGGLEMPDREYYLSASDSMRDIRSKYQTHVSAMLKLTGFTDPTSALSTSSNWSTPSPKNIFPWRIRTTSTRRTTPGSKLTSPQTPPASTGRSTFAAPGSAARPASSSGSPQPSQGSPLSLPPRRSTHGKIGWFST